jgi:hypothetical protein
MVAGIEVADNRHLDGPVLHLIGEVLFQEAVEFRVTGTLFRFAAAGQGKNEEYRKGTTYDFLHVFLLSMIELQNCSAY